MQNTNLELIIFSAVSGLVITSTIGFIVFVIFKYQKSHLQHLTEIETQKNEFEKTVLDVKLEIQEQTSHDIAREIHDSIGHGLTLAKLQLNTLLELPSETDFNKVRMAVDLLGQSIQQLSDISKNLNAEALLQQGLLRAIDEEISRLRTLNRFEVQYEVNGFTSYMESQQEIVIYRVIQEGFQNILKHSDARCAQLQLHFHPEYLHVSLIDDGNGFDPSTPKRTRSTGLSNIENRIRFLSGEFQIQSSLKKGTRIQFTIPYQANVKFN
jgi:signal transduction histidine kinase